MIRAEVRVRSPKPPPEPVISTREGLPDQVAAPTPLVTRTCPTEPVVMGKLLDPITTEAAADKKMLRAEEKMRSPKPPPEPLIRGMVRAPVMVGEALRTTEPVPVDVVTPVPPFRTGSGVPE